MSGCMYCRRRKNILRTDNGSLYIKQSYLIEDVTWDYRRDDISNDTNAILINYCPMCGRRLANE